MAAVAEDAWRWSRGLKVETVESSCCGMAGAFGYGADTYDASMRDGRAFAPPRSAQGRAGAR